MDKLKNLTLNDKLQLIHLNGIIDTCNALIDTKLDADANAVSASKLKTARTIAISGGATGTATAFDGSGNITIPVTALDVSKATVGTLAIARGGTGSSTKNFVDLSSNQTISGNKSFDKISLPNADDTGVAKSAALVIGEETGIHMKFDNQEIIVASVNEEGVAVADRFHIQAEGGSVAFGATTALTSFEVKSNNFTVTTKGVTCATLSVTNTLNIPGGKIWIA